MKAGILWIVLSIALSGTSAVWAEDSHHPERAGTDKAKPVVRKADKPQAASPASEKQFEQARQQMKKMLAQMNAIRQTKDPKERQRLMDEHMQTMRDTMQAMHGMGGPMMMDMMGKQEGSGGGMGKPMDGNGAAGMNPGQHMEMMEKRMDMMQMMMEQMMARQSQQMPTP